MWPVTTMDNHVGDACVPEPAIATLADNINALATIPVQNDFTARLLQSHP